jgi:selenocysteine lyase/cysteine desulfurase
VLYGRGDRLSEVDVPRLAPAANDIPERIETGTQNHEGIVGAAAAVDFLAGLLPGVRSRRAALRQVFDELGAREQELFSQGWTGLSSVDGVTLYGPPPGEPRTPTLAFSVGGRASEEVARALADEGVFVTSGDFYAATLVRRLGHERDGLVRAGCACYTNAEEVDRLVAAVRKIAAPR